MTDPISGNMTSHMANQVSQVGEDQASVSDAGSTQKTSFKDVLSNVQNREVDQADGPNKLDGVDQTQKSEGPAATRLRDFLDGMQTDETSLDKMMARSMSGAKMSQQDLLKMQSLVYSYSQKVELASKLVSNATSGMKQIMNTQV